jgi:hypothetical protein
MKRLLCTLLIALLALAGCGEAPQPTLDLKTQVRGSTVQVELIMTNFTLGKQGHAHLFMDAINTPVTLITPKYVLPNVAKGEHKIRVELTHPDHTPIGVEKTVTVTVP